MGEQEGGGGVEGLGGKPELQHHNEDTGHRLAHVPYLWPHTCWSLYTGAIDQDDEYPMP